MPSHYTLTGDNIPDGHVNGSDKYSSLIGVALDVSTRTNLVTGDVNEAGVKRRKKILEILNK